MFMMLFGLVSLALWILKLAVIGRVLGGWFGADPSKGFMKTLHVVTEPLFQIVRPIARKIPGPVDWTPAVILVGLDLLGRVLR